MPITWDIDPIMITLFDTISIRYYSLLFASGLLFGYILVSKMMLREGMSHENVERLAFYVFLGTVLGARIGHCLFYEPSYYLPRPWEMILPFKFVNGDFQFTGFLGLASHGGITGVFLAIWIFCRQTKANIWGILDKISIGGALAAVFIRLANFFNSEILGKATGSDWGIIFKKVDNVVRHPAQLYESMAYLLIFITIYSLYRQEYFRERKGFLFGLFFTFLFIARFAIEFFKINQVAFEEGMSLNMGQLLSIPGVLIGVAVMIWKRKPTLDGQA